MKYLAYFIAALVIANPALAQAQLAEKLEKQKSEFARKADPQTIKDFDQGVEEVRKSGVLETAKKQWEKAPDFTLPDVTGQDVALSELLRKGPVVVIWYRGEWCPYCNIQLQDIQKRAQEFTDAGASIVAISPEKPDHGQKLQKKLELDFHVLTDKGSEVAKKYGITYTLPAKVSDYLNKKFDLKSANNDDGKTLPLAASYVIAPDSTIIYAFIDADYRKRPETSVLIEEVKKIPPLKKIETKEPTE